VIFVPWRKTDGTKHSGISCRNGIVQTVAVFLTLGCSHALAQTESGRHRQPKQDRSQQLSDIFRNGLPHGLIQFNVLNPPGSPELYTPRLAMLDRSGLHIYKREESNRSDLIQEFFLPNRPDKEPWDTLEAFPARDELPGVVLWASAGVSYSLGTVVCYAKGKPRVVFQGQYFDFAHIALDDIPEILVEQGVGFEASSPAKSVIVWTWNGSRYVRVEEVAVDQLYSQDVVKAIRAAQKAK
jgi:hypothetical protein